MSSTQSELEKRLKTHFPDSLIQVTDLNGQDDHFECRIISERFKGLKLIQQHQLVYQAAGELMSGPIHALQLLTVAPD